MENISLIGSLSENNICVDFENNKICYPTAWGPIKKSRITGGKLSKKKRKMKRKFKSKRN